MKIDRIELADCGSPETIISEILRQIPDMPIPVPIEELAAAVDITAIHRMTSAGFEGGLVTQPERRDGVILVNSNGSAQRQRFTIGHELGHYLIMAHKPPMAGQFTCSKADMAVRKADRDDRAKRMEMEANRFSAGILMPLVRFKPDMRSLGSPDLKHILTLAERYDISKEATALQYVLQSDAACAVVLSKDGMVKRTYKPGRFPFIEAGTGSPLPMPSLSARMKDRAGSAWDELSSGVWLSARDGKQSVLLEQALPLSGGWMMTLLVHEEADDEDDTEGNIPDAFDVWENPQFPSKSRRR